MDLKTTDLCDANAQRVRVVHPGFRDFGGRPRFSGCIATVRVFEDNVLVRRMLDAPGDGRVLVVDGGASMRCALLGDRLAQLAADQGWAGVVINGCIRDSADMAGIPVGVRALAVHPRKSLKTGAGETGVPVAFGGVIFNPGEFLYADEDGIVISDTALS